MPAVPSNVVEAVCKRWPDRGPRWLNDVHDELTALCAQYDAKPVQVMHARYGLVVEVQTSRDRLVMKSSPDPNGINQAKVSAALADLGVAPKVHEILTTAEGTWTVADRVLPGTAIGDVRGPVELTALTPILEPIIGQPPPAPDMPTLAAWLGERLADPQPNDLPIGREPAPATDRRDALEVLEAVAGDGVTGLCHGDASPWNILVGEHSRLWLVDPRGMTGETEYDVAVIALKGARYVPPKIGAIRLASSVGVDAERVLAWLMIANAARV